MNEHRLSANLRRIRPVIWWFLLAPLIVSNGACTSLSVFQQNVERFGFEPRTMAGDPFQHAVMMKPGKGQRLHVYIEGDGVPWIQERWIAQDPTPWKLIMPTLMAMDSAPSLFIGRPCYFQRYFQMPDPSCHDNQWWTSARYSQAIINSLNRVLDLFTSDYDSIWLIGHSGGGTLAMLMAGKRDDIQGVVTLAGNLDTEAWSIAHHYSPLSGSLNPAQMPPLPAWVQQWHFLGTQDKRILPSMTESVVKKQSGAHFELIDNLDHSCCWNRVWPDILEKW